MKKAILTIGLILMTVISVHAQDAVFSTNRMSVPGMGAPKMEVFFDIKPESVSMKYTGRSVIKAMEKRGMSPVKVFELPLTKSEVEGEVSIHTYQGGDTRITVTLFSEEPKKNSVKIQIKDDFTGEVSEQLYFSI